MSALVPVDSEADPYRIYMQQNMDPEKQDHLCEYHYHFTSPNPRDGDFGPFTSGRYRKVLALSAFISFNPLINFIPHPITYGLKYVAAPTVLAAYYVYNHYVEGLCSQDKPCQDDRHNSIAIKGISIPGKHFDKTQWEKTWKEPLTEDSNDIRYYLLDLLKNRCVNTIELSISKPTTDINELPLIEIVRKIDYFLRVIKYFSPLTSDSKEKFLKELNELALKRQFFVPPSDNNSDLISKKQKSSLERPISEKTNPPSTQEILMTQCINILSLYPDLQPKFDQLYKQIGGMEDLKLTLFLDVIYPWFVSSKAQEYHAYPPNGILFYGPPGCGKTFITKLLSQVLGVNTMEYSSGTHGSTYTHGASLKIQQVFDNAKAKKPSMIFIDEASSVFPKRDQLETGVGSHYIEQEESQFLRLMEGCSREGILVICATNFPEKMDTAILRTGRIDKKFYLAPPDENARKEMFLKEVKLIKNVSQDIDYIKLAQRTNGFVSSDIKQIVENASRSAMNGLTKVTMQLLENEISKAIPSISPKRLKEFEQARAVFESQKVS